MTGTTMIFGGKADVTPPASSIAGTDFSSSPSSSTIKTKATSRGPIDLSAWSNASIRAGNPALTLPASKSKADDKNKGYETVSPETTKYPSVRGQGQPAARKDHLTSGEGEGRAEDRGAGDDLLSKGHGPDASAALRHRSQDRPPSSQPDDPAMDGRGPVRR